MLCAGSRKRYPKSLAPGSSIHARVLIAFCDGFQGGDQVGTPLDPIVDKGLMRMDSHRFDMMTRALSSRFSRRSAVRAGAAGAATTVAVSLGLRPSRIAAAQTSNPPYSVIRRYILTESSDAAVEALNTGYLPQLQQTTGFLQYIVVTSDPDTLTTISIFETEADYSAAEQDLSDWVSENLALLLPSATEETTGDAVIFAPNTDVICGVPPVPAATPTVPATPEACTGIGCSCNGGVEGACDEGLVCCQSQMNGDPIPGGEGMCAAEDACGDGAATPIP
jgi:hypothetical protein